MDANAGDESVTNSDRSQEQIQKEQELVRTTHAALHECRRTNSVAPLHSVIAKFGGDVNFFVRNTSLTALCCIFQCPAALKFLLESGADPKMGSKDGLTPGIHYACAFGSVEHVELFIEAGADPLIITEDEKQSCLHRVAEHSGDLDVARLLIRLGVPVNHPDYNGFTPLHFACWKEKPELARILLDGGADLEWRTEMQSTPLITAVYHRSRDCSMILIERGAQLNARTKDKMTPLDAARLKKDSWMIVELLERGAVSGMLEDVPKVTFDTTMSGAASIIGEMYSKKPALPPAEETMKLSKDDFIHLPAFNDVELLIKYQHANPEYKIEPNSPLAAEMIQIAVHSQATAVLSYFSSLGISLDGDGDERSPLMNAVQYGYEDVVKFLLRAGVDVTMRDYEHCTARSLAVFAVLHPDVAKAERIFELVRHGP
eukprot:TRINITY_DN9818_c0_g1_i1.p1 TRINITY_DN9818_c0_g1~~TRINITY_DN9818_c0_g1_i1.p1  ORF type:complete len:453 (-),score=53.75 TRINITY_DN9818_c0_g1_i1:316-1605(-)